MAELCDDDQCQLYPYLLTTGTLLLTDPLRKVEDGVCLLYLDFFVIFKYN